MVESQEQTTERRVLLLPGHPVSRGYWKALAEHYQLCFLYPQAKEYAASIELQTWHLGEAFDNDAAEWANSEAARMTAALYIGVPDFGHYGVNLPIELDGNLPRWWPGYTMMHAQNLAQRVAAMNALLARKDVAGCVVHEDVAPDTRSMVLWCRDRGIQTIHVPHANCHLRDDAGPDIHRETRTDWIAASGQYAVDWYARQGFPRDKIRIVGAPQFDELYNHALERDVARRVLGFAADDTVIAYATTWAQTTGLRGQWEREHRDGLDAMLKLALDWKAQLIIHVHQSDAPNSEQRFTDRMKEAGVHGRVTRAHHIFVLRAADILIAQGPSNMCVDAAILDTPSCYIRTEGFDYTYPLPYRCDPDGLADAAQRAMDSRNDPAWQDCIKFYNDAHPDGEAVERLTEFVREICR